MHDIWRSIKPEKGIYYNRVMFDTCFEQFD